jgi:beta-phosphoglucomutase
MNIKAVMVDLDGVLTSSSREHFLAWAELAHRLGHKLSPSVYDKVKGISRMESLDIVLADIGMSGRFSDKEKAELAKQKNDIYVGMISRFTESNLAAGAVELFEFLKRKDIKVALGSVSKNSGTLLKNMNISEYFDYTADPATVKNAKPAPDIFLAAADHFSFDHR